MPANDYNVDQVALLECLQVGQLAVLSAHCAVAYVAKSFLQVDLNADKHADTYFKRMLCYLKKLHLTTSIYHTNATIPLTLGRHK